MEFNEQIQCDEQDYGWLEEMRKGLPTFEVHGTLTGHIDMEETAAANEDTHTFTILSENIVMIATVQGGKLLGATGFNAKVEQVEMNTVKITKNKQTVFLELGEDVQWLQEREV
jgi:hypothetical protein